MFLLTKLLNSCVSFAISAGIEESQAPRSAKRSSHLVGNEAQCEDAEDYFKNKNVQFCTKATNTIIDGYSSQNFKVVVHVASILLSKNVGCEDIKQFTECFENFFTDDLTKTSLTAELEQLEKHKNVKKLITKLMGSTTSGVRRRHS